MLKKTWHHFWQFCSVEHAPGITCCDCENEASQTKVLFLLIQCHGDVAVRLDSLNVNLHFCLSAV